MLVNNGANRIELTSDGGHSTLVFLDLAIS